jgi:hypothetical protein
MLSLDAFISSKTKRLCPVVEKHSICQWDRSKITDFFLRWCLNFPIFSDSILQFTFGLKSFGGIVLTIGRFKDLCPALVDSILLQQVFTFKKKRAYGAKKCHHCYVTIVGVFPGYSQATSFTSFLTNVFLFSLSMHDHYFNMSSSLSLSLSFSLRFLLLIFCFLNYAMRVAFPPAQFQPCLMSWNFHMYLPVPAG